MSLRIVLAAAAALAMAAPALAQTAPAAPPASAPSDADQAASAFEAKGEAFEARMEAMENDMRAAVAAAGGDRAKLTADLDAIVATYQPDADAFAVELSAFLESQAPIMTEEQRTQMTVMAPVIEAQITGAPAQARAKILEVVANPAPAAPQ